MNKITRKEYPDIFEDILDHVVGTSQEDYRKDSNFFVKRIIELNKNVCPNLPILWGFWETNQFIVDHKYGYDEEDIDTLIRVELRVKTIKVKNWIPVIDNLT